MKYLMILLVFSVFSGVYAYAATSFSCKFVLSASKSSESAELWTLGPKAETLFKTESSVVRNMTTHFLTASRYNNDWLNEQHGYLTENGFIVASKYLELSDTEANSRRFYFELLYRDSNGETVTFAGQWLIKYSDGSPQGFILEELGQFSK